MSFILDALKSLEQKRHQKSVPDLTTVHFSAHYGQKKMSPWLYLFAAALLLNAAILAVWLFSGNTEKKEVIALSITGVNEPLETIGNKTLPAGKTPLSKPAGVTETIKEKPADPVKKARKEENPNAPEPGNNITALRLDMSTNELDDLKSQIRKEQMPADGPLPAYLHPAKDVDDSSLSKEVLELGQLPISVREELPRIRISSHIYSNNPNARIVNINGSVIREGESVIKGLKVDEITMTGIILDYQGYLFRMRAF